MDAAPLDLDAYFGRIGYTGPASASLATLASLHELHPAAIAFENLAAFMGEAPALDPASLQAKLVRGGRGGWCFEQNLLFAGVLESLGFRVRKLAARVRWNVPEGVVTSRSHCLLHVEAQGEERIVDVGFGGQVLTAPLRLAADEEQATPHEPFRLRRHGADGWLMEARLEGEWRALYAFDLREHEVVDYEVSNWYLANHPDSHFVKGIVAARTAPGLRHALRSARYAVHHADGRTERRFIEQADELLGLLEEVFGLRVPPGEVLRAKAAAAIEAEKVSR